MRKNGGEEEEGGENKDEVKRGRGEAREGGGRKL